MKARILNALLLFTSFFGYLEWSGNSKSFLFQAEAEILSKAFTDPVSVIHPFTVLPFVGQLLLVITLFQKNPGRILTYAGIAGIGLLMLLILLVGILAMNYKIVISTLPFLGVGVFTIRELKRKGKVHS
jgi:hypothetical protein